jgi:hypothetical protein
MSRIGVALLLSLVLGNAVAPVAGADLITYLPMNEGSGSTAANVGSGGSTYDGTFNSFYGSYDSNLGDLGLTTWNDPVWATGRFGGGVQFSGAATPYANGVDFWCDVTGNNLNVAGGGGLNAASNATVSMWVKWQGTQPQMLSSDSNTTNQYGIVLARGSTQNPVIGLNYDGNPATAPGLRYGLSQWMGGADDADDHGGGYGMPQNGNPFTPPGDNTWANIVTTYGDGKVRMYMNGTFLREIDGSLDDDSSQTLTIGGMIDYRPGQAIQLGPSNSTVDDFGVFGATLTVGEAKAIFNVPSLAALGGYDLGTMNTLFELNGTASVTIGDLKWNCITGLTGHAAGDAWTAGGRYFVQLGDDGSGVVAAQALNPGDANGDGVVDINDLSKLLANYDKTGMQWADGDFDANGIVDINDLSKVLANYDRTFSAPAGVRAVPEPGSLALLAAGLALLACAWRKRT